MSSDWAAIIDAWALRFLHEMDYKREAANATLWYDQICAAGVDGVVVPEVSQPAVCVCAHACVRVVSGAPRASTVSSSPR